VIPFSLLDRYSHFREPAPFILYLEDGSSKLLQNIGIDLSNYTNIYPRRPSIIILTVLSTSNFLKRLCIYDINKRPIIMEVREFGA
jgi:hypothetical protein